MKKQQNNNQELQEESKKIGHMENDCWTKRNRERYSDDNTQEIILKETGHSENNDSTK